MTHNSSHSGGGRRSALTWVAVAAAVAGVVALLVAWRAQQSSPPQPPASAAGTVNPATSSSPPTGKDTTTPDVGGAREHPLPVSEPRRIDIPAIDVHSDVVAVGKNADGTIEVPQPGPDLDKAAWYDESQSPGRIGPSVMIGHVDTTEGPSIFYDLGDLRPGDQIQVARADGSSVTFTVDGVRDYPQKSDFPTALVYGGDLSRPSLRLVTCSNFDAETGHYVGNLVVFAHMTAVHRATA